ncbi:6800_t:CDS:2 [Entrophospora sp. SA101]|nr:6800_t:CDS:2 [Entrophospora sp. SA101]
MSFHVFQQYIFDVNSSSEIPEQNRPNTIIQNLCQDAQGFNTQNLDIANSLETVNILHNTSNIQNEHWIITNKFRKLMDNFKNTLLNQYICIPCVYCGKLMYPKKCKWIPYDNSIVYPLSAAYPNNRNIIKFHPNDPLRVPVCNSCKSSRTRYSFQKLCPIPDEILSVPLGKRSYLSPVFMHSSLGRNVHNSNYTEYRILSGDIRFSKNLRCFSLYSGMEGAFLENSNETGENIIQTNQELINAANWLKENNPYIRPYSRLLTIPGTSMNNPFPIACHIPEDQDAPKSLPGDIVLSASDYPSEIHNEDSHYSRLMAGFVRDPNSSLLPIRVNDPHLEPLLFPDIFPDGEGYFCDSSGDNRNTDHVVTLGNVEFLTTDPPTMRNKAIKPINYLLNDEESPYWNDHIEKYFARPNHEEFNELTYPSYFEQYNIIKSRPDAKNYPVYVDLLGNYVVKRTTKKLVRFHYLKFQDGEQYFYQQILKNLPCRSEEEILGNYATYKQHFLFLYPEIHNQLQQNTANYIRNQEQLINAKFSEIMENILNNLQDLLCDNISQLLQIQLNSLKISPMINPQNTIIDLPDDQLHESNSGYKTLAFSDTQFFKQLQKIDILIIEEISMVSALLFTFISEMFAKIHENTIAFGGLSVIAVGDLAQLPPASGLPVYKSSVWKLFYPLFLRQPQRQNQDFLYYKALEDIRFGNITQKTHNFLLQKFNESHQQKTLEETLNTTYIVGYRETAARFNRMICNMLPVENDKFWICDAIDTIDGKQMDLTDTIV